MATDEQYLEIIRLKKIQEVHMEAFISIDLQIKKIEDEIYEKYEGDAKNDNRN